MAERMRDGGGTRVDQAERNEQADPAEQERSKPVEAERRPTYKTLDEQQGRLTEAEERFERGRRTIGLFLGPLVFLLLLVLPLGLEAKQQALAAVLGLVVVWWITEAIPIDWPSAASPSTGTRPRGSTGARSSCSAPASPSGG